MLAQCWSCLHCQCLKGLCWSKKEEGSIDPNKAASDNVEKELLNDRIDNYFKFKILLLGAGESGKSTIVKQLKLIYKKTVTEQEWNLVAISLHQNLADCFKALFYAIKNFATHQISPKGLELERTLHDRDDSEKFNAEEGKLIGEVWEKDEAIKDAYSRRSEFWMLDSFSYYIANVKRFCDPNWKPSEDDSVMARIRTTGIVQTELEHKIVSKHEDEPSCLKFLVVDVGGQRNERKKWMHCFDDVVGILFIVNLAGYHQVLFEDTRKNRMHESVELFDKVSNNPIFAETPIFLFLNKKDLFETMVQKYDMKMTFDDYTDGLIMAPALQYIQNKFTSKLPPSKKMQEIQVVSARIKMEIKHGFEDVKKTLYDKKRDQLLSQVSKLKKEQKSLEKSGGGCGCCG